MASQPRTAVYTHRGRRRANQDAVLALTLPDGRELVALADGMGGQAAGEVASARTLEVLVRELEIGTSLEDAIRIANRAVYAEAVQDPERQGMGTTLVALLRSGNSYQVANVGDSRAYRIDAERMEQITGDHSFAADAVRTGSMSAADAAVSPWRNALTRAVGTDPEVEVDLFGPFGSAPPHAVLLCSDGLYKTLPDRVIADYVRSTEDVEAAVNGLSALAYRQGSDDNISAVAVEFDRFDRWLPAVTAPLPIDRQRPVSATEATPAPPPVARRRARNESRNKLQAPWGDSTRWTIAALLVVAIAALAWGLMTR